MAKTPIQSSKKKCNFDYCSHFSKGEVILSLTENPERCGVIVKGRAHISTVDESGAYTVLEYLSEGSSFSMSYTLLPKNVSCFVTADTDCTVRFINTAKVLGGCSGNCGHHEAVMKDLCLMSAEHARAQSARIDVLSRRSLREKLLAYLTQQEDEQGKTEITIPLSLTALAEYLCVDRSAMMREIGKMNSEGIIASRGRTFALTHRPA